MSMLQLKRSEGTRKLDNKRNRPYNGQPHTDAGVRGETLVAGLTMRDIVDCYVMAVFDSSHHLNKGEFYEKAQNGTWEKNDLFKLDDFNLIDPVAISQNLTCRIEKMMGIFPNVPELKETKIG